MKQWERQQLVEKIVTMNHGVVVQFENRDGKPIGHVYGYGALDFLPRVGESVNVDFEAARNRIQGIVESVEHDYFLTEQGGRHYITIKVADDRRQTNERPTQSTSPRSGEPTTEQAR